jgi:large subunit ribosomal protein L30
MADKLKITMIRSRIGCSAKQRKILDGLGLRKMNQTVIRNDDPAIRGMVDKLDFMLRVEKS